jgi:uncharacterized protein (DUF305 family)
VNRLAVVLAAVALVAVGCGGDDDGAEPAGGGERVASGQVPFDQAFIDAMVPHHREAIGRRRRRRRAG